jgi:N-acetylglutamate synthase-like GNAT family acetyltransferase
MLKLEFRLATINDADAIHALIELAYRGDGGGWASESDILKGPRTTIGEVRRLLSAPLSRFVLGEADGRLVACALIQKTGDVDCATDGPSDGAAYFGMFAVDPALREGGVGKSVLAQSERQARALWASSAMVMTVISLREVLIQWYERRGYKKTGVRIPFPFDETTGEVRRDFDLVELKKVL